MDVDPGALGSKGKSWRRGGQVQVYELDRSGGIRMDLLVEYLRRTDRSPDRS